jgi:alginate O-acetyltransferase complex protein AlgI
MEITSFYFIVLSILSLFVYYVFRHNYRIIYLSLLSAAFISTYSFQLLIYVLVYSWINYTIGKNISRIERRGLLFWTGIVFNLLQLILLKYVTFTINPLIELLGFNLDLRLISVFIIPVGVSFFTLQAIGYLINVQLGWEKAERNFMYFFLYLSFFPRFISGPIDRSNLFFPQLKTEKKFNQTSIIEGLRLILLGLFKKVAVANQLAPIVIGGYANLESPGQYTLWIVLLLQPLYLYFDFSGYTDIAFGVARFFGIELRPNFNRPFMAENMTNFWKRFHISLSSWFHDYIFVRTMYKYRRWGKKASILALFLTWFLFGIWHGAGWNFMLLGLLQGIAIYYEFITKKLRVRVFAIFPDRMGVHFSRIVTYIFYSISLTFFFAPNLTAVFEFFSRIFITNSFVQGNMRPEIFITVIVFIAILLIVEFLKNDYAGIFNQCKRDWYRDEFYSRIFRWIVYFLMIAVIMVFNNDVQQFIYFQF